MPNPIWLNNLTNDLNEVLIEGNLLIESLTKYLETEGVYRAHYLSGKISGLKKAIELAVFQKISKKEINKLMDFDEKLFIIAVRLQLFEMPKSRHKDNFN